MRWIGTFSLLILTVFLFGCAETPKQPVMRPIPPPPPTPPPDAVYTAPAATLNTNTSPPALSTSMPPSVTATAPPQITNSSGLEVTSNFVGNGQSPLITPAPGPGSAQIMQPAPQYEMVPPRPGPDYIWKDGYWQWNNGWVWIPGNWVYTPPSVIIVPEPWYYHRPYYYHRYHRW